MKLSSVGNLVLLSVCSLTFVFMSIFSSDPKAPEIRFEESFNHRRSLSFDNAQILEQVAPPEKNQWPEVNLFGVKVKSASPARAAHNETEMLPANERNLIGQKISSRTKQRTRVILMSYMRAGSTFTGDLFQFSPDVMYFYEPLLYTNDVDSLARGTPVRHRLIGQFISHPNPPETQPLLESILRCQLTATNMHFVLGTTYSQSFTDFLQCQKSPEKYRFEDCVADVAKRCQNSPNVLAKVLRLKMWEVDDLMSRDPQLKVIHLVRDPRGIVMSRRVASYFLEVSGLCNRLSTDAELSIELQRKYPGRLLTLRYEDLARQPMEITKLIYDFAGIDWTKDIASRVQSITSPTDTTFQEKIFDTKRKNSTATAFNWRLKFDFGSAYHTQNLCSKMMRIYGYKQFKTDMEMRDIRLVSMEEKYDEHLLKAQTRPKPIS